MTLTETLEAAARPRTPRPARPTPPPAEPEPVEETPCPSENGEYLNACRKLDGLTADRMALEARLERAEARALRHGPARPVVLARAAALFAGEPIGFQAVDQLDQLREDRDVAQGAEDLARKHRDSLLRSISAQVGLETRPRYNALVRESYAAFARLIEAEEKIDAFLADLTARGVRDAHHRQQPTILGCPISRATLCQFHDQLRLVAPSVLAGTPHQDRPNTPTPNPSD